MLLELLGRIIPCELSCVPQHCVLTYRPDLTQQARGTRGSLNLRRRTPRSHCDQSHHAPQCRHSGDAYPCYEKRLARIHRTPRTECGVCHGQVGIQVCCATSCVALLCGAVSNLCPVCKALPTSVPCRSTLRPCGPLRSAHAVSLRSNLDQSCREWGRPSEAERGTC